MLIFENDGKGITNMGVVKYICQEGRFVVARFVDDKRHIVAQYATDERAEEVIRNMHRTPTGDIILPRE